MKFPKIAIVAVVAISLVSLSACSSTGAKGDTGSRGSTGAAGATGAKGDKGDTGARGATGASGASGSSTSQGATGATGSKGATGARGATGAQGATGSTGAPGAVGAPGVAGPAGPAGAAGADGVVDYAYVYTTQNQPVFDTLPIEWQSTSPTTTGITQEPDSLILNKTGDYDATYFVSALSDSAFELTLNGVAVPGSIYGSQQSGVNPTTGSAIFHALDGDILQLTAAAGGFNELEGAAPGAVTASLTVTRLG